MDWLFNNPIADMYGPDFLWLYATVILTTLVICHWSVRRALVTEESPAPRMPLKPDPLAMAYLRGGENEVTRVLLFDLLQRGYLELETGSSRQSLRRIHQSPDAVRTAVLTPIEREVFAVFARPQSAAQMFATSVPARVKRYCGVYQEQMVQERLIPSGAAVEQARATSAIGVFVIVGTGLYKCMIAVSRGHHNVGFLIAMALAGLLLLVAFSSFPRLNRRGRDYVAQLQQAFAPLKLRRVGRDTVENSPLETLLMVSVFGMDALEGTSYAEYRGLFLQATACDGSTFSCASTGGCGGGGGCGGAGGGGGCGGCGGGGH